MSSPSSTERLERDAGHMGALGMKPIEDGRPTIRFPRRTQRTKHRVQTALDWRQGCLDRFPTRRIERNQRIGHYTTDLTVILNEAPPSHHDIRSRQRPHTCILHQLLSTRARFTASIFLCALLPHLIRWGLLSVRSHIFSRNFYLLLLFSSIAKR